MAELSGIHETSLRPDVSAAVVGIVNAWLSRGLKLILTDGRVANSVTHVRQRTLKGAAPTYRVFGHSRAGTDATTASVFHLLQITAPENASGPLQAIRVQAPWSLGPHSLVPPAHETDPSGFKFSFPVPARDAAVAEIGLAAAIVEETTAAFDLIERGEVIKVTAVELDGEVLSIPGRAPWLVAQLGSREDGKGGTGKRVPLHSIAATEPAILWAANCWAILSPFVGHLSDFPAKLCGFNLTRNSDWLVESTGDPGEVYEYLGRVCNVSCKFCYLFGNPPDMAIARGSRVIPSTEMEERLQLFEAGGSTALFRAEWENNETLVDPKLSEVLPRLRRASSRQFFFVTNGNPLTDQRVGLLADVKPVHVIISLNAIDPSVREAVMGESAKQSTTAYSSLAKLADRKVSYGVSLAAFPDFPTSSLEETIDWASAFMPAYIRINLPGFTRFQPPQTAFETGALWRDIADWLARYRRSATLPILLIPSAFDDQQNARSPNEAWVIGSIANSPAANAGIVYGDVILSVGGLPTSTRAAAQRLLSLVQGRVELTVRRASNTLRLSLHGDEACYPYAGDQYGKYTFPHGIVMAPGLSLTTISAMRGIVARRESRKVWVIASRLLEASARDLLAKSRIADVANVELIFPNNTYLGGNIVINDMATIGDFARCLEMEIDRQGKPDLIFIPSSTFNEYGRDISGRHWGDLEEWLGVRVELMETERFQF